MKLIKWGVVAVLLLLVIGVIVVYVNLNSIVRAKVETQASSSLNVPTTLKGASVSLLGGRLGLSDLEISSPQGFSAPQMMTLDETKVRVSYGQLRQDPVHVAEILLAGPKLVIEQSGGKLNFQALMDQPSKPPPTGEPMKLIIDQLSVTDAMVILRPGIPGLSQEISVPIPTVSLQNVGSGEGNQNGAAVKEVVMQVVTAMASKASESDKIPPEVQALLKGNLREVAGKLASEELKKITAQVQKQIPGAAGEALGGVLANPQKAATNPSDAIEKGLGGLLQGSSEPKKKKPTTRAK